MSPLGPARLRCWSSRSRIHDAVEDVGQQIHADIDQADDDGSAQHRIHIGGEERRGDVAADAGPGEHGLGQDGALQDIGEGQRQTVISGTWILPKAWRQTTRRSDTPLTRAVMRYS